MTPEILQEKISLTYDPGWVVEFIETNGRLTIEDLKKEYGWENLEAGLILGDLRRLSLIASDEDEYVLNKERDAVLRSYHLTETAQQGKQALKTRELVYTPMPTLSKLAPAFINDLFRACEARNISLEALAQMMENQSPELREIADEIRVNILNQFSAEELRGLASDLHQFK